MIIIINTNNISYSYILIVHISQLNVPNVQQITN